MFQFMAGLGMRKCMDYVHRSALFSTLVLDNGIISFKTNNLSGTT